ncbi:GAF domain-containing sensor histidine kinase [Trichocoleus sp. FACHB-262]|uniref:GAF domain-containing sensor histidine kinase n=1 Tax=Trichocoleus sp. FACHB-262 TaxID=2692869 RepID=UPI001F54C368|nr:GAF domain-containing sensor histidine kinase [Trichocoleus sp. FACHB-262]
MNPENRLFFHHNSLASSAQEQQRLLALVDLGLLEAESVPVFEEATQTAALFLDIPVCMLGVIDQDRQWIKSAVGLSRLGLMNELAASRQMLRSDSFCSKVIENQQVLAINDTSADPDFATSFLAQRYRIRAYLGVPLVDSAGNCLGTLAVMDLVPRNFTSREIQFLELTARWSMSEFERNRLVKAQQLAPHVQALPGSVEGELGYEINVASTSALAISLEQAARNVSQAEKLALVQAPFNNPVKIQLLAQLTQELRTPLTSVMGMASVLNREIYGPLTTKQKEYLNIIYQSGQYLLSLVNEILELGTLDDRAETLNLASVDIEMLCQQAINTLEQAANRREQQIRLSIEPGSRIWLLDKNKVRQILYHLVFGVIQASSAGSIVRIHVSRKQNRLNIAIWVSHPWLGDSLPNTELYTYQAPTPAGINGSETAYSGHQTWNNNADNGLAIGTTSTSALTAAEAAEAVESSQEIGSRESLGVLLSRQLAEMHGGQISIQGTPESGYRYVVSLPQMTELEEVL